MDQNMGFRFPRLGFDSLWVYTNGDRRSDRHLCTTFLFLFRSAKALPPVAMRPSGTALTLRLPVNGSLSVFDEPVVGLAEMVVAKETVVG